MTPTLRTSSPHLLPEAQALYEAASRLTLRGLLATFLVGLEIGEQGGQLKLNLITRVPCVLTGQPLTVVHSSPCPPGIHLDPVAFLRQAIRLAWEHELDEGATLDGQPFFGDPELIHSRSRRP